MKEIELQKFITSDKPAMFEREMYTNTYKDDNGEWVVELETNIAKYDRKCAKQGWKQKRVTYHEDGSWVSSVWVAPAKALSIRKADPPKRVMSEEHKASLLNARLSRFQDNKNK